MRGKLPIPDTLDREDSLPIIETQDKEDPPSSIKTKVNKKNPLPTIDFIYLYSKTFWSILIHTTEKQIYI